MSRKYHVTDSGDVRTCTAEIRDCQYGGREHHTDRNEARAAAEKFLAEKIGDNTSLSKEKTREKTIVESPVEENQEAVKLDPTLVKESAPTLNATAAAAKVVAEKKFNTQANRLYRLSGLNVDFSTASQINSPNEFAKRATEVITQLDRNGRLLPENRDAALESIAKFKNDVKNLHGFKIPAVAKFRGAANLATNLANQLVDNAHDAKVTINRRKLENKLNMPITEVNPFADEDDYFSGVQPKSKTQSVAAMNGPLGSGASVKARVRARIRPENTPEYRAALKEGNRSMYNRIYHMGRTVGLPPTDGANEDTYDGRVSGFTDQVRRVIDEATAQNLITASSKKDMEYALGRYRENVASIYMSKQPSAEKIRNIEEGSVDFNKAIRRSLGTPANKRPNAANSNTSHYSQVNKTIHNAKTASIMIASLGSKQSVSKSASNFIKLINKSAGNGASIGATNNRSRYLPVQTDFGTVEMVVNRQHGMVDRGGDPRKSFVVFKVNNEYFRIDGQDRADGFGVRWADAPYKVKPVQSGSATRR